MRGPARRRLASAALTILLTAPARAEHSSLMDESAQPEAAAPVVPAYRFVEGISDGVFDFMRGHIIAMLLPEGLTRSLKAAPRRDSAALFGLNLRKNEARYLDRVRAAYPVAANGMRPGNEAQLRAWRSWAAQEQIDVAADSLKDTMVERYKLEIFGESSGKYARDRRNWDPGFLTMAGVLGGAFLYVNGMHAGFRVRALEIGIDLAPGHKLRQALQGDGNAHNLVGFELGRRNAPITLATEWGLSGGHMKNERIGLNYRLRY